MKLAETVSVLFNQTGLKEQMLARYAYVYICLPLCSNKLQLKVNRYAYVCMYVCMYVYIYIYL